MVEVPSSCAPSGGFVVRAWVSLLYDNTHVCKLIMAALRSRGCGHYIFALWFLLSSFFLSFFLAYLSRRRLDVYHTFTHGVALVQI